MTTSKQKLPSPSNQASHTRQCMEAFGVFGDVPTLAIIFFLIESPKRFSELERLTGTNPVTLAARLKRLTEQHIIKRSEHEVDNQSVTYSLDDVGKKMLPILQQIEAFAKELPATSAK